MPIVMSRHRETSSGGLWVLPSLLIPVIVAAIAWTFHVASEGEEIAPNVRFAGLDISGLSASDAADEVEDEAPEDPLADGVGGAEAAGRHSSRVGLGAGEDDAEPAAGGLRGGGDAAGGGAVDEEVDLLRGGPGKGEGGGGAQELTSGARHASIRLADGTIAKKTDRA